MIQLVTGCNDCPYRFDDEYNLPGTYCLHPNRPTIKLACEAGVKTVIDNAAIPGTYVSEDGQHSFLVIESGIEIKDDENFEPVTPDWCPLKKESITIEMEKI